MDFAAKKLLQAVFQRQVTSPIKSNATIYRIVSDVVFLDRE